MGKRGPKPRSIISTEWSANLAYAIGLIASDGCLYNDGRHIALVSNDIEQLENFTHCLGIDIKPKRHIGGYGKGKAYRIQFGSVLFYNFLLSIGLTPAKSKTLGAIEVPDEFFFDFLRGSLDGDGCFYSYWDPRWRSSHMFYVCFLSAGGAHIEWMRSKILTLANLKGSYSASLKKNTLMYEIRYAKKEALELIKKMYYSHDVVYLPRKKTKIDRALEVEREQQGNY